MKHPNAIVRAAALAGSFGLMGGYVACQHHYARPATSPAGSTEPPAAQPVVGTAATDPPTVLPGSKNAPAAFFHLLKAREADTRPAAGPTANVPTSRRMLLPGSKSDSSTFVHTVTGVPDRVGQTASPAVGPSAAPAESNP